MQIPVQTCLIIQASDGERVTDYVSYAVGSSRWGIRVSIPQILNRTYTLPASTPVKVSFVSGNKLLEFTSYVMGYEQTVPPCMVLAEPQTFQEGNRRNHLRLRTELPVSYIAEGSHVIGERTSTVDVSLGGIAMATRWVFPRGTPLTLSLEISEQTLALGGQVAWSGFRGKMSMTGVEFTKVSESSLKNLSKFLLSLEREMRS